MDSYHLAVFIRPIHTEGADDKNSRLTQSSPFSLSPSLRLSFTHSTQRVGCGKNTESVRWWHSFFFFFCPFFLSLSLSGGYFPACSWFCFTGSQVFSSSLCSFLKPSPVQLAWQRPKAAPHNAKASSGHWVDWQIHSVKSRQKPGGELCQLHLGKLSVWWPCHLSPNMLVRFTKAVIHSYSFFWTIIVLKKKKKARK